MRYNFDRQELKNKSVRQFKEGDVIKCGKYFIWVKYGHYTTPTLLTTVNTKYDLRDLQIYKQPCYIREFISRSLEEINNAQKLCIIKEA